MRMGMASGLAQMCHRRRLPEMENLTTFMRSAGCMRPRDLVIFRDGQTAVLVVHATSLLPDEGRGSMMAIVGAWPASCNSLEDLNDLLALSCERATKLEQVGAADDENPTLAKHFQHLTDPFHRISERQEGMTRRRDSKQRH